MAETSSELNLSASETPSDHDFDILGLGMSMMDTIQVVDVFPSLPGVTQVEESALMGGGPVPTALCAAARLGARTAIIDRVGDDWRGDLIREDYLRFGVDVSHFEQQPDRTSSLGIVLVRRSDGERHIVFQRGSFSELETEELPIGLLRRGRFLHLNGRHWPACIEAARVVREVGGVTSFDGGAHRWQPRFEELLPLIDILVVARDFAVRFAGSEDHEAQLEALRARGAAVVGITDGVRGSWFLTAEGDAFHQPAFPIDPVVDTTGCGDVFHGAFLFARSRGMDWRSCARFASAAAGISATGLGGRGRLPATAEVEERIAAG